MRSLNRLLSLLLALGLVAAGVLLAIEVVAVIFNTGPAIARWKGAYVAGQRDAWDSSVARLVCAITAGVGLLLLVLQLKRRRPDTLALADPDEHTDAGVTPKGVRAVVKAAALSVDGISGAAVTVTRRAAKVRATSRVGSTAAARDLRSPLAERVDEALSGLQLQKALRVKTTVTTRGGQA